MSCEICSRKIKMTFHHLIPKLITKKIRKNKKKRKEFKNLNDGIDICNDCHVFLHREFSEKELFEQMRTLDSILKNNKVKKWIPFAQKIHRKVF